MQKEEKSFNSKMTKLIKIYERKMNTKKIATFYKLKY